MLACPLFSYSLFFLNYLASLTCKLWGCHHYLSFTIWQVTNLHYLASHRPGSYGAVIFIHPSLLGRSLICKIVTLHLYPLSTLHVIDLKRYKWSSLSFLQYLACRSPVSWVTVIFSSICYLTALQNAGQLTAK